MALGTYETDQRVLLQDRFRQELFSRLLVRHNWKSLEKLLKISHASLYAYKNGRTSTVPLSLAVRAAQLAGISKHALDSKIVEYYKPGSIKERGLIEGRATRRRQLKSWTEAVPRASQLFDNGFIDVDKWWHAYGRLINFGAHRIKRVITSKDKIFIEHSCWAGGRQKDFNLMLPSKIPVDDDFQYFFGLWCGDRVGGGRIGVANKCLELNMETVRYLKRLYQKPSFVLLKGMLWTKAPRLPFKVDAVQVVKGMPGDWVLCVQSVNGVLRSFFHHMRKDLDEILDAIPSPEKFFAGLFDAEGNVFLEDGCFRWACKNRLEVDIYTRHLRRLGLFHRYDGSNMVTYNKDAFAKLILPHIKHPDKINKATLVCHNRGYLDKRFRGILRLISQNEGKTATELAAIAGKTKLWPQIRFLERHSYLKSQAYPKRVFLTSKGLQELRGEGQ